VEPVVAVPAQAYAVADNRPQFVVDRKRGHVVNVQTLASPVMRLPAYPAGPLVARPTSAIEFRSTFAQPPLVPVPGLAESLTRIPAVIFPRVGRIPTTDAAEPPPSVRCFGVAPYERRSAVFARPLNARPFPAFASPTDWFAGSGVFIHTPREVPPTRYAGVIMGCLAEYAITLTDAAGGAVLPATSPHLASNAFKGAPTLLAHTLYKVLPGVVSVPHVYAQADVANTLFPALLALVHRNSPQNRSGPRLRYLGFWGEAPRAL
jgi:hypothetical protein